MRYTQAQADANRLPSETVKEIERKHISRANETLANIARLLEGFKGGLPSWDRAMTLGVVNDNLKLIEKTLTD